MRERKTLEKQKIFNQHQMLGAGNKGGGLVNPLHGNNSLANKVLTYVEYRAVSGVFQNIDPHPPSPPSECVLPRSKGGGVGGTRSRGAGGGGVNIFEDARHWFGLSQFNPFTV
jgi:hypothetical protein